MLNATADLNTALVSYILTDYAGFTTAAGYVGPNYKVDHDISLLVPEIWCRMSEKERDPKWLIENECLEEMKDFEHGGKQVPASRLGWRITRKFCRLFLGRIFDSPTAVFDEAMLKPESQDLDSFVDGIFNITEAQQRVARGYLSDNSVTAACPPLQAIIHIMAEGSWNGKSARDPEVRKMFTREYLVNSDWYAERLKTKQQRDAALWERHANSLERFLHRKTHQDVVERLGLKKRYEHAKTMAEAARKADYLEQLRGTIGADPIYRG